MFDFNTSHYLKPNDTGAFYDLIKKEKIKDYECPQCKGYGGWNLKLNAYPLREHPDTAENRHKYAHFRASCNHCNGYGWVSKEDSTHIHNWIFVQNLGRCYNRYKCDICEKIWDIDSSD